MNRAKVFAPALIVALGLAAVIGSFAFADPAKEAADKDAKAKPDAAAPEMKLPPGWTEADMKVCMEAATPGKMHEYLAKSAGEWKGKCTMWMAPETEPIKSECTNTVTMVMDGRYQKGDMAGDMPGMGPFSGMALTGYDNVSQKFVSTWIDNMSTGIMNGTGELSADGKVLSWKFTFNCPLQKKPVIMREIETTTGPDTKTLEMFSPDPKTGKEYKMMSIEFTKKKKAAA